MSTLYDPNNLFQKLEPLEGTKSFFFFDDERLCLYVPVTPAPKGSASPIPKMNPKTGKLSISFVPGSGPATREKLNAENESIRDAVARLWRLGFVPYDEGCVLDLDLVFLAPKARRGERKHLTYPDRDKALRAVQDMISPPVKDRKPQMDQPHLVTNDSTIYDGYAKKWWMHVWNEETGLQDETSGLYICLRP